MRTKLLRKLRKSYSWHYDHDDKLWFLLNKHTLKVSKRTVSWLLISIMCSDSWSFGQIMKYGDKKEAIRKKTEYRESLRKSLVV